MQKPFLKSKNLIFLLTTVFGISLSSYLVLVGLMQNQLRSQDARLQASISTYNCDSISSLSKNECYVLYQLYEQTTGQNWYFSQEETRWFSSADPCKWTGITCNATGQVSKIELISRNLVGNFPAADWRKLANLALLDLRANHRLTGSLPLTLESTTIRTLLTTDTSLCLPTSLTDWHKQLATSDEINLCSVITPTPALTLTPTPKPKSCNQNCSTNNECANNLMCYKISNDQRCRLASNPTSDSCQGVADQGLDFTCNHYCANTGECADGLSCWYNRCRQPDNVSSESCQPPTAQIQERIATSCNQTCSSNKNCAVNMRCYNGVCRLATHPNNSHCQPISSVIRVETTNSTNSSTGASIADKHDASSSQSGQKSPTPTTNLPATPTIVLEPTITAQTPTRKSNQKNALSALISNFKERLKANFNPTQDQKQFKIGLGLIVVGVGLVFIATILSKKKKATIPKPATIVPPPSSMIAKAKQKNLL